MAASPITIVGPPRRTLAALLEERERLPVEEVDRIAKGIGEELQRHHERGEVFGSLRPDSVHLASATEATPETVELESEGAYGMDYASPEQVSQGELDARTDLWCFGALLYRALVGRPPFKADDEAALKVAILQRAFPRATSLVKDLPPDADAFFTRALRKDKVERFQTVDEMVAAFARLADRAATSASPAPEEPAGKPISDAPEEVPADENSAEAAQRSGRIFRPMIGLACVAFISLLVYVNIDAIRAAFDDWTAPGPTPGERQLARAQALPKMTLPTPDGGEKSLPLDRPFIMNVWLEGCPDCIPCFERWRDLAEAGEIPDLPVVNVAYGRTDPAVAAKYAADEGLVMDPDGKSVVMPLDIGKFTTFVVAPDGKILFRAVPTEKGFAARLAAAATP